MPVGMTAGAIISEHISVIRCLPFPTPPILLAMGGAKLFDHIKHMIWTVTPSLIIALIIYAFLGMGHTGTVDVSQVSRLPRRCVKTSTCRPCFLFRRFLSY